MTAAAETVKKFRPATRDEIRQEFARRSLLKFTQYTKPDYDTNWHHRAICGELEEFLFGDITRLILCTAPRHGKALEINTPIPTPDGWKRIVDLRAGDFVFDENGSPTEVIGISPVWENRPVYKVKTNDGDEIIADAAHEWEVRLCRKRKTIERRETAMLATSASLRAPMVKIQGALDLPYRKLPIDPYVLGVWLGNGRNQSSALCVAINDRQVIDRILSIEHEATFYDQRNKCENFRPGLNGHFKENTGKDLQSRLRALGLLHNKHIPMEYLRASKEQRVALLQGLIDTDGYVNPDGQIEFCSVTAQLASDVQELVRSLGRKASLITGRSVLNGVDHGMKYRVMFYMSGAAYLERKARYTRDAEKTPNHYIKVEPAGIANTVCIEVASSSHLFLAGRSMIPTCNSELVSRRLPAYILGRKPDTRIIATSHNSDLAEAINRDVQRIIDDQRYAEVFPGTRLNAANIRTFAKGNYLRNASIFEIVGHRGMYLSAGVGGSITGRGFDIGIIDDPIKNRAEANSVTFRENIWDWYRSTFYTRREKNAKILVIMTRWHEDDLVGRLLELQKHDPQADQWRVVCFPAVFEGNDEYTHPSDRREIGESLWPGKYPLEDLNRIKATLGSYEWAGLFQQRPAPSGGGIFMTSWWGYYDNASLPNGFDEIIQSWDMTFKDAGTSDFVVGQVWARAGERYYLLDQVRERLDFPGTIRAVMNLSYRWPEAKLKLVEDKANGPAVISMLKRELSGLVPVEPQGSKEARAYAVSALVESGNVFLPARASWLDDFIAESASFPNGRHDDQIDAMTQALNRLSHRKGRWSFIAGRK